ncbi:hypothetical protein PMAYCL1PPCAC_22855, partial [Pristionchus mayeri]
SSLSSLESLPMELAWGIFEFVPDAALDLRLVSHAIKYYVDQLAMQAVHVPVVDIFKMISREKSSASTVTIDVIDHAPLSALGCKLRSAKFEALKFSDFQKRSYGIGTCAYV